MAVERIGPGRRVCKESGVQELRAGEDEGRGLRLATPAEPPVVVAEEIARALVAQCAFQGTKEKECIHSLAVPRLG